VNDRRVYRSRPRPARLLAPIALVAALAVAAAAAVIVVNSSRHGGGAAPSQSATPTHSSSAPASPSPAPRSRPISVAAWSRSDLASLHAASAAHALDEVDLDWYHSRADGSLVPESVSPSYLTQIHSAGLSAYATITNRFNDNAPFDPAIAEAIIGTPAARAREVATLVALCRSQGYDGIDLDWEALHTADRANFTAFVRLLARRLHAAGKRLSVDVYWKTTDRPAGPESDAKAAEDYAVLGAAADELKLMTYGEHGSFTGPGPLASSAWMQRVLDYAESQVDPAKIWLGVPFYGFDWGSGLPRYILWSDARRLIQTYRPAIRHSSSGEPFFHYTDAGGIVHTVYFQDRHSVGAMVRFARSQATPIAGVAIWVMGGEDSGFWPVIARADGR
jgi:spore germination protein YaaH